MARKRTLNRSDLRAQAEAAEAREKDAQEDEEVEEEADDDSDDDAGDDEDAPKAKKKPKAKAKAKPKAEPKTKRARTPKEVRMKAIWVVFDNASKRIKEFPYSQREEADKLLAEKIEEKKGTFYISLVKEPLDS